MSEGEGPHAATPPGGLSRRRLLQLGASGLVVAGGAFAGVKLIDITSPVGPKASMVAATEAKRRTSGRVVTRTLTAAPATVDLGGRKAETVAFNGSVPGPEIRLTAGDRLRVRLQNDMADETTIHWHGIALRNDMDGVPDVTMSPIAPGGDFEYSFIVPDPGTYWFHPHVGVQIDTGLHAPLIVEDPDEPGAYDDEVVLVLDDWTDGMSASPKQILAAMARDGMGGMTMGSMDSTDMPSATQPLGADTGDVSYPAHLINGRVPQDPIVVSSKPGRRLRLRVINAGGDTAYRLAVGGHRLTVTHSDGYPVRPVEVDTLIIGMGERYDLVLTSGDGAFPITAVPEGKEDPPALAILRTSSSTSAPSKDSLPAELSARMLAYGDLAPTEPVTLDERAPDRELDLKLTMADGGRRWLINDHTFQEREPLEMQAGERVRLNMRNESMMFHPMHLHGHTFAVAGAAGRGSRKDTINVLPMQTISVDVQGDNPGQWLVHCHNIYHGELGMMTVMSYVS